MRMTMECSVSFPNVIGIADITCCMELSDDGCIHYFCHPDEDMRHDSEIMIRKDGQICTFVGDELISSHPFKVCSGMDIMPHIDAAIKSIERVYKERAIREW